MLAKEKIWKEAFNINSELSQNRTEKQIMPFKTTVTWLCNDMWCYLVIAFFDWKVGVFQQRVVNVYCILVSLSFVKSSWWFRLSKALESPLLLLQLLIHYLVWLSKIRSSLIENSAHCDFSENPWDILKICFACN